MCFILEFTDQNQMQPAVHTSQQMRYAQSTVNPTNMTAASAKHNPTIVANAYKMVNVTQNS
jgi:hypothetical protein